MQMKCWGQQLTDDKRQRFNRNPLASTALLHRAWPFSGRLFAKLARRQLISAFAALCCGVFLVHLPAQAQSDQWTEKTQLIWDEQLGELVRRTLIVWNPDPAADLEFSWEPASGSRTAEGKRVSGRGILIWRKSGSPTYDPDAVFSRYEGEMRDGRPHGSGKLTLRDGMSYAGEWQGGMMKGRGLLKYASGDEYSGLLKAGVPDGRGRYASASGEIFEGSFVAGRRHGPGKSTLPGGAAYDSQWNNGEETDASQARRFAQSGNARRISVGIVTNRTANAENKRRNGTPIGYEHRNSGRVVEIFPDNKGYIETWKGSGWLPVSPWLPFKAKDYSPVFLVMRISNQTGRNAQIVGGYIDVASSAVDNQPYFSDVEVFNADGTYGGKKGAFVRLKNVGWGRVRNGQMDFAFTKGTRTTEFPFTRRVPDFDSKIEVQFGRTLQDLNVNLPAIARAEYSCPSSAQLPKCAQKIARRPEFGTLGSQVYNEGNSLVTSFVGRFRYSWIDHSGQTKSQTRLFKRVWRISFILTPDLAEKGDVGNIEKPFKFKAPIRLKLEGGNYRKTFPLRTTIRPAQIRRFGFSVNAAKSSNHTFRIALRLADGTTVKSHPVKLLYFRPRLSP